MALIPFTSKFEDNSTETGFQFTFYCDICSEKFYKNKFVEYKVGKKAGMLHDAGRLAGMASKFMPNIGIPGMSGRKTGDAIEKGADTIFSERFGKMSPQWHKEYEAAFEQAASEGKRYFKCCPRCKKWSCENDWNEQTSLCIIDSPRVGKQTICPQCSKLTGEGKFCNNCGAPLTLKCPKCGTQNQTGIKFCSECGTKLIQ